MTKSAQSLKNSVNQVGSGDKIFRFWFLRVLWYPLSFYTFQDVEVYIRHQFRWFPSMSVACFFGWLAMTSAYLLSRLSHVASMALSVFCVHASCQPCLHFVKTFNSFLRLCFCFRFQSLNCSASYKLIAFIIAHRVVAV